MRTVKSEMDDFVAEMKKHGKPVEYTVLKDVGHGLARPESRKQIVEGTGTFFKSQMSQAPTSTEEAQTTETKTTQTK